MATNQDYAGDDDTIIPGSQVMPTPNVAAATNRIPARAVRKRIMDKGDASGATADDYAQQLRDIIDAQNDSIDERQKKVNAYRQPQGSTLNLQPLLALTDAQTGSNLAKSSGYVPPLTEQQRTDKANEMQDAIDKEQGGMANENLKALLGYKKSENDSNRLLSMMQNKEDAGNAKTTAADKKSLDFAESDLGKQLNPFNSQSLKPLADKVVRSRAISALFNTRPNFDANETEAAEVAGGLASLTTGQNRVPYEMIKHYMPASYRGEVSDWISKVVNHPMERENQAFMARLAVGVKREEAAALDQAQAIRYGILHGASGSRLMAGRPESYANMDAATNKFWNQPQLDIQADPNAIPNSGISPEGRKAATINYPVKRPAWMAKADWDSLSSDGKKHASEQKAPERQ